MRTRDRARRAKSVLDRAAAAILLALLSPALALIALWIVLEDGRPALFVQRRAGLDGRAFPMLKFRTMVRNAVDVGRRLDLSDDPFGVVRDDPRITRAGRFLRRTGLDEVPQLFNVLVGQMSLVGPRPDLLEQVANYTAEDRRRLAVLPGITGLAQVKGRDEIGWRERIEIDVWYIENWSLGLDLRILLRTLAQVFRGEPDPVLDVLNIERSRRREAPELELVDPAEWDALLRRIDVADMYFRRAYVDASCLLEPGRPSLLHVEDRGGSIVFPVIVRDVPGAEGVHDVTTAYGYGGPIGTGPAPPWEGFFSAYEQWCTTTPVIATFVRFHPLFANHVEAASAWSLVPLAGTVGWRLDGGDLFEGMHAHHRRLVRKAMKAGVEIVITEGPSSLENFRTLYGATMRRRGASSFYLFTDEYWHALTAELRDATVLVEAVLDGRTIAAGLCFGSPPWLHYHLGASDESGRETGAMHLVMLETAVWARSHGYSIFHMGGGVGGGDDPLLVFKRRFDPGGLLPAFVGKRVHRPVTYRELAGTGDTEGYFPAYRSQS